MRRRTVAALLAATIAILWAVPAFGGPSLANLSKRITTIGNRESRHYESMDRRINAAVLLSQQHGITTDVQRATMTQNGRFYSGSIGCLPGYRLTGGGVDWGYGAYVYTDYAIVMSAPDPGGVAWRAQATQGLSPSPDSLPNVYAVCIKTT